MLLNAEVSASDVLQEFSAQGGRKSVNDDLISPQDTNGTNTPVLENFQNKGALPYMREKSESMPVNKIASHNTLNSVNLLLNVTEQLDSSAKQHTDSVDSGKTVVAAETSGHRNLVRLSAVTVAGRTQARTGASAYAQQHSRYDLGRPAQASLGAHVVALEARLDGQGPESSSPQP